MPKQCGASFVSAVLQDRFRHRYFLHPAQHGRPRHCQFSRHNWIGRLRTLRELLPRTARHRGLMTSKLKLNETQFADRCNLTCAYETICATQPLVLTYHGITHQNDSTYPKYRSYMQIHTIHTTYMQYRSIQIIHTDTYRYIQIHAQTISVMKGI